MLPESKRTGLVVSVFLAPMQVKSKYKAAILIF